MSFRNWRKAGLGLGIIFAASVWVAVNNDLPRRIVLAVYGPGRGYAEQLELMNKTAYVHMAFDIAAFAVMLFGAYMILRGIFPRRRSV